MPLPTTSIRKEQLKSYGAHVKDDRIVRDGHILTSSNPGTAFDVAFLLLDMLMSKENVKQVKDLMGHEKGVPHWKRPCPCYEFI